jgi:hypothetical protein
MDLVMALASTNENATILDIHSFRHCAIDVQIAMHVLKSKMYITVFNRILRQGTDETTQLMSLMYHLMIMSLLYDGRVFLALSKNLPPNLLKVMITGALDILSSIEL